MPKPGEDVGKGFVELLLAVPSFGPQMGMKLLEIRTRFLEEIPKHDLSEEDKLWARAYANSLMIVAQCGAVHQAAAIQTLKVFVDRGKIERTLSQIEESGKSVGM